MYLQSLYQSIIYTVKRAIKVILINEVKKLFPLMAAAAVILVGLGVFLIARNQTPEQTLKNYLKAKYVNDRETIYSLASSSDRRWRTLEEHQYAFPLFPPDYQELINELSHFIKINSFDRGFDVEETLITVHGVVPDANHPNLVDLLYGQGEAIKMTLPERRSKLRRLGRNGFLPVVEFSQKFRLIHEHKGWVIFLDWATGYQVEFLAEVREEIPFQFRVEPKRLIAKPGETISAIFHVQNLSDSTYSAKAIHLFEPPIVAQHTDLLECFCFFEDTFLPGEKRELPVVIRLHWDIPVDIGNITVLYEYHPIHRSQ